MPCTSRPPLLKTLLTLLVALGALAQTGCNTVARATEPLSGARPELIAEIRDPRIDEASGLAASRRRADRLWLINDGGNPASLFAVGLDGQVQGVFEVDSTANLDWEDLASFTVDGTNYLLIADIGNNHARNRPSHLYLLIEPEVPAEPSDDPIPVHVVHTLHFNYPDGPRDAEAMAVDPVRREILVLSKRDQRPVLYRLPLRLDPGRSEHVAERLGSLAPFPAVNLDRMLSRPLQSLLSGMPTALDITADGRLAMILTYNHLLLLQRGEDEEWASAIRRRPEKLAEHDLTLAEGAGFSADGREILFTSEFTPAPIWRLTLPTGR